MANPVNGQIVVTVDINSTTEAGWKAAQTAIQEGVKAALEAIEIKAVTIDAASLGLVANTTIIEGDTSGGEDENTEPDAEESSEDAPKKEKKGKKDKGEKESKADKAAKGKKKGRK